MHLPVFQQFRRVLQKNRGKKINNVNKCVNKFGKSMNFKKICALLLIKIEIL